MRPCYFLRDLPEIRFGLVAKRAAEGISAVCSVDDLQEAFIPYACALARCCLPNLRHRHAKVRKATVDAIRRSVALGT